MPGRPRVGWGRERGREGRVEIREGVQRATESGKVEERTVKSKAKGPKRGPQMTPEKGGVTGK